jgi:hypothetical protein
VDSTSTAPVWLCNQPPENCADTRHPDEADAAEECDFEVVTFHWSFTVQLRRALPLSRWLIQVYLCTIYT